MRLLLTSRSAPTATPVGISSRSTSVFTVSRLATMRTCTPQPSTAPRPRTRSVRQLRSVRLARLRVQPAEASSRARMLTTRMKKSGMLGLLPSFLLNNYANNHRKVSLESSETLSRLRPRGTSTPCLLVVLRPASRPSRVLRSILLSSPRNSLAQTRNRNSAPFLKPPSPRRRTSPPRAKRPRLLRKRPKGVVT